MFLAHFSGTPLNVLLEMPSNELRDWFDEAISLHNRMNSTDG
jgi:hypothetical protein